MRFRSSSIVAATVLTIGTIGVAASVHAGEQAVADGCAELNDPVYDRQTSFESTFATFAVGDVVTVTASEPSTGTPSLLQLRVDDITEDTGTFPDTLGYEFTAVRSVIVLWEAPSNDGATVTWDVSCTNVNDTTTTSTTTTVADSTTTVADSTTTVVDSTTTEAPPTSVAATTTVSPGAGAGTVAPTIPATGADATNVQLLVALTLVAGGALAVAAARRRTV